MSDFDDNSDLISSRGKTNKKVDGDHDSGVGNRRSSRKPRTMVGKEKAWCLFYFNVGEKALYSVPKSWVCAYRAKTPSAEIYHKCWWPKENSSEATLSTMNMLIKNCSEPNETSWSQREGKVLGTYTDLAKCETALASRDGLSSTESEENGEGFSDTAYENDYAESLPCIVRNVPASANPESTEKENMKLAVNAHGESNPSEESSESGGSAKRPAPEFSSRRRLTSVFSPVQPIESVELVPTEGNEIGVQRMFSLVNSNMRLFMEKQNDLIRSMNGLHEKVDALLNTAVSESEQDNDDPSDTIIRRMASPKPEVRAKTNYMECLEVFRLPVKSLEELKTINAKLEGDDKESKRQRNALINALIQNAPGIDQGNKTVASNVRDCLYAIAPVFLWQYFSSQGKSGTTKSSLAKDLPQIYRVVMAAVIGITKAGNNSVISTIGVVIRSCPTRAESRKYRLDHPELLQNKTKEKTSEKKTPKHKTTATVDHQSGKKRPLSSDDDSEEELLTYSPECSPRQQPPQKTPTVLSAPGGSTAGQNSSESGTDESN